MIRTTAHDGGPRPILRRLSCPGLAALLLAGCMSQAWGVGTVYSIRDLDEEVKARLETEFTVPFNRYGFEVVDRGEFGEPFRFRLNRLRSMRELRDVQVLIQRVSRDARVPVVLQQAVMEFASVSGQGRATITVSGRATAGATVVLDIGGEEVWAVVEADGSWHAEISRSSQLSRRGGWIYGLIRHGSARQYLKMNVLDTSSSINVLARDLPAGSPLLRR